MHLWFGLLLVLSGQFILVANGPRTGYDYDGIRYLCPALGLLGLVAIVAWRWPLIELKHHPKALLWYKTFYLAIIVILTGLVTFNLPAELRNIERHTEMWLEAHRFKTENDLLSETTVYYYKTSSPKFALYFGNGFARHHFFEQLSSLYPNFYEFKIVSQRILDGSPKPSYLLDDILSRADTVPKDVKAGISFLCSNKVRISQQR